MTQEEFVEGLEKIVSRIAYLVFLERQSPPYLIYAFPDNDDFKADNQSYLKIKNGFLELYTSEINFDLMEKIENFLNDNEIPHEKVNEDYLIDEKIFFVTWNFQLIDQEGL